MTKLWNYLKKKSKKTIHELSKEFPDKTYRELEIYKEKYEKEHELCQAAEGETPIIKAIGMNSPEMKEAKAKLGYLRDELDRVKRENNDLHNKVAALLDAVDPDKNLKKARESGM